MLHLNLKENEYVVISDNITVRLKSVGGKHAILSIDAPKDVPVLRGTLLERQGGKRPAPAHQ